MYLWSIAPSKVSNLFVLQQSFLSPLPAFYTPSNIACIYGTVQHSHAMHLHRRIYRVAIGNNDDDADRLRLY